MANINLKRGILKIDQADWDFIRLNYSRPHVNGNGYAIIRQWIVAEKKYKNFRLHRMIMNAPAGMEVDHINGDRLDNRRCNLRVCTTLQNRRASKTPNTNTTGYRGVSKFKRDGNFEAYLQIDRKRKRIGYFDCPIEAARARDLAALEHYGEFAVLNGV